MRWSRKLLRGADSALPVRVVPAASGKSARAEPGSLLYESGKVRHAGVFAALEEAIKGRGARPTAWTR